MFLTEQEIMSQHEALLKTDALMEGKQAELETFFSTHQERRFVFLGCGSSYMLAKSGQRLFAACRDTAACAIAGGDYLVNPAYYAEALRGSILVTLSRSGQTSEIVRAVKHAKEAFGCPVVSLSMKADNDIMPYSDLDITMDWCYDRSVCQTRTVTNLYAAMLLFCAAYSGDHALTGAVKAACEKNEAYKTALRPTLEEIAGRSWTNAVVLADGAVVGIAEEGALAFTEICMLHGRCFNTLDYRHGPIVLNDSKTLTIVLVQPNEEILQGAMINDLKTHGGTVVTVSKFADNRFGADFNIQIEGIDRFEAWGIPFIYVMQMTAFSKAISLGGNPDAPAGLDAFITL